MSKRKYSTIWLHFDDEDGQRAKCKHCHVSLSLSGGCHSNLKRHLKAKHYLKPLDLEEQERATEEIMKFEEPFDEQSVACTELSMITQQHDQELTEFLRSPSSTRTFKEDYEKEEKASRSGIKRRKFSVIWLHFEDEGDQRAKCKYCKARLSFSGGCHGNLRRHMKLKHPLTPLNVEEQITNHRDIPHYDESVDIDPLTSSKMAVVTQEHQINKSKAPPIRKVEQIAKRGHKVYFKTVPKRKYSAIWSQFKDIGYQRARCKHCETTLSFSGGCHGNLKRHLKLKHPQIERKLAKPIEVLNAYEDVEKVPTSSTTGITAEQIDRQVLKMLAKGHHSLLLVEEPEFEQLIQYVSNCPGYKLPSKRMLSNHLIPNIHMELLEDIKRKMQSVAAVCLTVDGWTSTTNVSCLAVTAHYINADTELTSHLLAYDYFENRYTAENLADFFKTILSDYELNNKITCIINNNDPHIVTAIRQGKWKSISCFAHYLNLTVLAAMTEIAETILKVKKVVEYFDKSAYAMKELHVAQNHMNIPESKLKEDVPKKWKSTFEMLQRVNQLKDAIISTLSLNRPELMLTTEDWEIIAETISILKPFYEVTLEISGEKNVMLSKVTVLYNLLDKHIAKCLPSNEEVTAMVINLQMGMASCFGNLEKNELYAESAILDPRFKKKGFRNEDSYEQALSNLRDKICTIKLPNVDEENLTTIPDSGESLWEAYDLEFKKTVRTDNNTAACIREFDNYINEEYLDRRRDPLLWWKEKKHLYPRVYLYVLQRLCIVATSVPCDQIFSEAGQTICERRTLLKPNKIESLVFLHNM